MTGKTLPGIADYLSERIRVPTLILRGDEHDLGRPKRAWERSLEDFMESNL